MRVKDNEATCCSEHQGSGNQGKSAMMRANSVEEKSFVIMLRFPSQILVWIILSGPVTNVFEWIFM